MLKGAVAAAVTPLRDGAFDAAAVGPYVDFLAGHGVDGLLALGTTGEGVLFSPARAARDRAAFLDAGRGRLQVAVHAGAQTTHDTVALAEHAARAGADAVAVIAPPYFALDEEELLAHFVAAARGLRADAVLPLRVRGAQRLRDPACRDRAAARAGAEPRRHEGLGQPWEKVEPYLLEGLDVFIGAEALLVRGPRGRRGRCGLGPRGELSRRGRPARARDRTQEAQERARARSAPRSSGSRSMRPRRLRSGCAASRSRPRSARRCAA